MASGPSGLASGSLGTILGRSDGFASRVVLENRGFHRLQDSRHLLKRKNSLAKAVCFNRLGELRDRSFEAQRHRASGLNPVVAAIILWNTVCLEHTIGALRQQGRQVDEGLLKHVAPVHWSHINPTDDYSWRQNKHVEKGGFRPLRISPES